LASLLLLPEHPSDEVRVQASKDLADVLTSLLTPSLAKISDIRDRSVQQLELSRLALLLAACKAEKGQYPDQMDALAPAYLKAVPKDFFTGAPLTYKKTDKGYILYSAGPNMKDDGGKRMDEDHVNFDIVVKVE
jgi:hypothetical protein